MRVDRSRWTAGLLSAVVGLMVNVGTGLGQPVPMLPPPTPGVEPCLEEMEGSCKDVPAEEPPADPYGGDFLTRQKLLGGLFGARYALADHGVTFDTYLTQFYQGVDSGGREQEWRYGGKLDYFVNLDGDKLMGWKGLLVNMHAETRYGEDVNNIDGLLAPSNIAMNFPKADANVSSITGLKVTQALSENFAVYAGKLNTLDDYAIKFLGGPGLGGFMNTSLVFNPILARTVPYSAAAAGAAVLVEGVPVFTLSVIDPEERATKGLQDLYTRGAVLVPDLTLRVKPFGRPGTYNLGGTYSNARYRSTDPEPTCSFRTSGSLLAGRPARGVSTATVTSPCGWIRPMIPATGGCSVSSASRMGTPTRSSTWSTVGSPAAARSRGARWTGSVSGISISG